jgi:hypothetical protein
MRFTQREQGIRLPLFHFLLQFLFSPWHSSLQWAMTVLSRLHDHTQTHTHTQSVGFLWTSDWLVAENFT